MKRKGTARGDRDRGRGTIEIRRFPSGERVLIRLPARPQPPDPGIRTRVRWSRWQPKRRSGAVALQLLSAACLVWAGVVIGVSFLATPAKFLAPTLTLSVALDVGRHTFGVLRPVEIAWATLTLGLAWLCRARLGPRFRVGMAALWATLALELLWVVPTLDARALRVVAGETIPPTYHHVVYIILEILKLVLLLGLGGALGPGRGRPGAPASGAEPLPM